MNKDEYILKMAPFDRPLCDFLLVGHSKYSSHLVPFYSFLTLNNIYRDLEIGVRYHSMSSKLVPFESLCAVSYSPSIVTTVVSLNGYEIFSVNV